MGRPRKYPLENAESETSEDETESRSIPPAPAKEPKMGDKTPAFVEWMRDYHPEEYRRIYIRAGHSEGPRKTHLTGTDGEHPSVKAKAHHEAAEDDAASGRGMKL